MDPEPVLGTLVGIHPECDTIQEKISLTSTAEMGSKIWFKYMLSRSGSVALHNHLETLEVLCESDNCEVSTGLYITGHGKPLNQS